MGIDIFVVEEIECIDVKVDERSESRFRSRLLKVEVAGLLTDSEEWRQGLV